MPHDENEDKSLIDQGQYSIVPLSIHRIKGLSPMARLIYGYLIKCAGKGSNIAKPRVNTIAEAHAVSARTITKCISELSNKSLINIIPKGNKNIYEVLEIEKSSFFVQDGPLRNQYNTSSRRSKKMSGRSDLQNDPSSMLQNDPSSMLQNDPSSMLQNDPSVSCGTILPHVEERSFHMLRNDPSGCYIEKTLEKTFKKTSEKSNDQEGIISAPKPTKGGMGQFASYLEKFKESVTFIDDDTPDTKDHTHIEQPPIEQPISSTEPKDATGQLVPENPPRFAPAPHPKRPEAFPYGVMSEGARMVFNHIPPEISKGHYKDHKFIRALERCTRVRGVEPTYKFIAEVNSRHARGVIDKKGYIPYVIKIMLGNLTEIPQLEGASLPVLNAEVAAKVEALVNRVSYNKSAQKDRDKSIRHYLRTKAAAKYYNLDQPFREKADADYRAAKGEVAYNKMLEAKKRFEGEPNWCAAYDHDYSDFLADYWNIELPEIYKPANI